MSYLNKVHKFEKQENYEGFVKALGVPEEQAALLLNTEPSQKVCKNGDTYTWTMMPKGLPARDIVFVSGVEFDENIRDLVTTKTTITVSGDTFTHVQKTNDHLVTIKKEFSGDKLKETITCNFWDGVAYRYYSA